MIAPSLWLRSRKRSLRAPHAGHPGSPRRALALDPRTARALSALVPALWAGVPGLAHASENRLELDRVDILSADPGTFLNYDVPMIGQAHPSATGIRFLEQVQVVLGTPLEGLYLGASISSQSFVMEQRVADLPVDAVRLVPDNLFVYGGVQTNTLIPRGLMLGAGWRAGPVRASLGLSLLSNASWRRLDYAHWHALPTLSVGVGRKHASE